MCAPGANSRVRVRRRLRGLRYDWVFPRRHVTGGREEVSTLRYRLKPCLMRAVRLPGGRYADVHTRGGNNLENGLHSALYQVQAVEDTVNVELGRVYRTLGPGGARRLRSERLGLSGRRGKPRDDRDWKW